MTGLAYLFPSEPFSIGDIVRFRGYSTPEEVPLFQKDEYLVIVEIHPSHGCLACIRLDDVGDYQDANCDIDGDEVYVHEVSQVVFLPPAIFN